MMSEGSKRMLKKHMVSFAVAVLLVCAALGSWFASSAFGKGSGSSGAGGSSDAGTLVAMVHDGDGGETALPLDEDGTYEFATSKGTNIVVVEDGTVCVSEADCANHDCVDQGAISAAGRQIVCLPHELWIEITAADGSTGEADSDTGTDTADESDEGTTEDALDVIGS